MTQTLSKKQQRERRHKRVRAKVAGTAMRPRLSIHRSNTRIFAQLIDDDTSKTLVSVSSSAEQGKTPRERAELAAQTLAKKAMNAGVKTVVFDRGGFKYAGTIQKFADAARAAGLQF
jgi:large subunit ribosomal protein L18